MSLRVSKLTTYPVKSLRGLALQEADLLETGFRHDRAWMLIDDWGSFLSQRQHPSMALIEVAPTSDSLRIAIPDGVTFVVPVIESGPPIEAHVWGHRCVVVDQGPEASQRLGRYLGRSCRLVRMAPGFRRELSESYRREGDGPVGFADSMPFLLTSEASLADLNGRLSEPVAMNRFRPNIVVDGGTPFQEESWQRLRIGE
ncbi:MAG TPA: MOSC N-terminal beta barrel domain-containing protein, partial [Spirochaetia bacterium]|nr:MOSC N-terminal beta barrel domain-containing protein [Spirochaetia bacterium]